MIARFFLSKGTKIAQLSIGQTQYFSSGWLLEEPLPAFNKGICWFFSIVHAAMLLDL